VKAVVLDFGGPVLLTPFERLPALERSLGLPPGTFGWRGPFDPAADPLWRSMQAGELSEPAYWASRAADRRKLLLGAVVALLVLLVSAMARHAEYQRAGDRNRISLVFGSA